MRTMQIYTKEGCKFSGQLRELLEERQIPYEETLVSLDSPEHHALGSTQEVQAAALSGMLDDLLVD